ncbi:probable splicing factor 3A subunit 1, partial [Tanacetum coccineum]
PVSVSIAKTKVDEETLFGVSQSVVLLKINVQELSETVGTLKHKIAREYNVPANKQKLIRALGTIWCGGGGSALETRGAVWVSCHQVAFSRMAQAMA